MHTKSEWNWSWKGPKTAKQTGAKEAVNPLKTEDLTLWRQMFLGRHLMRQKYQISDYLTSRDEDYRRLMNCFWKIRCLSRTDAEKRSPSAIGWSIGGEQEEITLTSLTVTTEISTKHSSQKEGGMWSSVMNQPPDLRCIRVGKKIRYGETDKYTADTFTVERHLSRKVIPSEYTAIAERCKL